MGSGEKSYRGFSISLDLRRTKKNLPVFSFEAKFGFGDPIKQKILPSKKCG